MRYLLILLLLPLAATSQNIILRCDSVPTLTAYNDTTHIYIGDSCYYIHKFWGNKFRCIAQYRDSITVKYKQVNQLMCKNDTLPKPPMRGLAIRNYDWLQSPTNIDFVSVVNNVVVRINWSDLQPTETGALNTSYIDGVIAWAQSMKAKGIQIQLKLRILNGVNAPAWVMAKVGSFMLTDSSGSASPCVRFWNPDYMQYWKSLQVKLAALYDGNEFITEVVNSGTAIGSGEAMIRGAGNGGAVKQNKLNYLAAGYTTLLDSNAIYASIDAMKVWRHTNIGMSLTPFQVITPAAAVSEQPYTTYAVTDSLCRAFGVRADIGNNGLRTGDGKEGQDWIPGGIMWNIGQNFIADKQRYGATIFYQTATDWRSAVPVTNVLDYGILLGAQSIELPNTQRIIQQNLTQQQLVDYDNKLAGN